MKITQNNTNRAQTLSEWNNTFLRENNTIYHYNSK